MSLTFDVRLLLLHALLTAPLASTGDASSSIRFCFTCQHLGQALAMLVTESLFRQGALKEILSECSTSKSKTMHDEGIPILHACCLMTLVECQVDHCIHQEDITGLGLTAKPSPKQCSTSALTNPPCKHRGCQTSARG